MKIHEYQAKELLAAAGAPVPRGIVASGPDEAARAFDQLGAPEKAIAPGAPNPSAGVMPGR